MHTVFGWERKTTFPTLQNRFWQLLTQGTPVASRRCRLLRWAAHGRRRAGQGPAKSDKLWPSESSLLMATPVYSDRLLHSVSGIIAPAWCLIEGACVSSNRIVVNAKCPPRMASTFWTSVPVSEHLATASKANLRKASPIAQRKPAVIVKRGLPPCYEGPPCSTALAGSAVMLQWHSLDASLLAKAHFRTHLFP